MSYQSISISLVAPETTISDADDWLRLEQQDFEDRDEDFYTWVANNNYNLTLYNMMNLWERYQSYCASDGVFETEIYVHKSRTDLEYSIDATWGTLSAMSVDEREVDEIIDLTTMSTYYEGENEMILSVNSASWVGSVFGENGRVIAPPTITLVDNVLTWGVFAVGSIRLNSRKTRDTYTLAIEARDDIDDLYEAYKSTVRAVYGTNVETLEVDLPRMTGFCSGGARVVIDPEGDPAEGDCYDLHVLRHKCTNEIIEERLVPAPCPEDET